MAETQNKKVRDIRKAGLAYARDLSVEFVADTWRWLGPIVGASLSSLGIWDIARANWQVVVGSTLALVANVALIWWVLRKSRHGKNQLLYFKSIAESCGIEAFWPPEENKEAWQDCVQRIANNNFDEIRIADCTGAETFANNNSLLGDVLRNHRGNIKILLIKRDSPGFLKRIEDLVGNDQHKTNNLVNEYRHQIDKTLRFFMKLCEDTRSIPRHVEIREYSRPAIWKMVIFGNYLWLQHYERGKYDNDTYAYVFRRNAGTMAPPLENVFLFRWNLGNSENDTVLLHQDERGVRHVWPSLTNH